MNFIIREAKITDLPHIVEFQRNMASETENLALDESILNAGVKAVFEGNEKGKYYVAENSGEIVASLMITYEWSDWRNGTVWWIQSVFVTPGFRRYGIFRKMYAHLKSIVEQDQEIRGLRLYVDNRNVIAQSVYESIGMNGEHYRVFEWMKS